MYLAFFMATLIILHIECQVDTKIRFIRDLQEALNVDWIIVFHSQNSRVELRPQVISLRKNIMSYFNVYTATDLQKLTNADRLITETKTMILIERSVNISEDLAFLKDMKKPSRLVWVVISHEEIDDELQAVYIPFDCLFIVARHLSISFKMTEFYKTSQESNLYSNEFGSWDGSSGLVIRTESLRVRRTNAHGQILSVLHIPDQTGGIFAKLPDYLPSHWRMISKHLNMSSNYTDDPHADHDIQIDSMSVLVPPAAGLEYFHVFFTIRIDLFYREVTEELVWTTYLNPFSAMTWFVILLWAATTSTVMVILFRVFAAREIFNSFSEFYLMLCDAMAVLTQQGSKVPAIANSVRTVQITQLLSSMMMFGAYSAVFISFITVVIHKPPFEELTLEGVLRNGRYNIVGVREKSYQYFKTNPHPTVRALFIKHMGTEDEQPKTFMEGMQRVCYGPNKLLTEFPPKSIDTLRPLLKGCRLSQASVLMHRFKAAWIARANSPYKGVIQVSLMKLMESGAIGPTTIWQKMFLRKNVENISRVPPIEFEQVLSLFAVLGIGICSSLLLHLIDFMSYKQKHKTSYTRVFPARV